MRTPPPPPGGGFDLAVIDRRDGFVLLEVEGDGERVFLQESGGHRWQRIPPTERKGRVHTSTVTVAVFELHPAAVAHFDPKDVEITATVGSGAGGQHRNKTSSAIIAVHRPSGERVRIENERSQHKNKATALALLSARLEAKAESSATMEENTSRRGQVGSGMRGDKIRTYRVRDDQVVDHRTGQRWSLSKWMVGQW